MNKKHKVSNPVCFFQTSRMLVLWWIAPNAISGPIPRVNQESATIIPESIDFQQFDINAMNVKLSLSDDLIVSAAYEIDYNPKSRYFISWQKATG